ncbi:hypothetical protein H6758_02875 [Candidatus Nomurabacteria bacterium]|nr:hypothetical protein [Candidatus Nomurabacteria bacterium]
MYLENAYAAEKPRLIECGVPGETTQYTVWWMGGKYEKRVCLDVRKGKTSLTYWELFRSGIFSDHGPWEDVDAFVSYRCDGAFWRNPGLPEWRKLKDITFPLEEKIEVDGKKCEWRVLLDTEDRPTYIYYEGVQLPSEAEVAAAAGCECKIEYAGIGGNPDRGAVFFGGVAKLPYVDHNSIPKNQLCGESTTVTIGIGRSGPANELLNLRKIAEAQALGRSNCWPMYLKESAVASRTLQIDNEEQCKALEGGLQNFAVPEFSMRLNGIGEVTVRGAYRILIKSCEIVGKLESAPSDSQPVVSEVPFSVPSPSSLNRLGDTNFQGLIGRAIKFVVQMLGSIAFVMFVYGGILFMFSGGNSSKELKAIKTLAYGGIGVLIILSSYILVQFLFSAFS